MLQLEVLILELVSVDGFATSAISSCEVTTLNHKLLDDTVEAGPFVAKSLLAGCESAEVLSSLQVIVSDHGLPVERLRTLGTVLP